MNASTKEILVADSVPTAQPRMILNKRLAKKLVTAIKGVLATNKGENIRLRAFSCNDTLFERFCDKHYWEVSRSEAFRLKTFLESELVKGYPNVLNISRDRLRRIPVILSFVPAGKK